MNWAVAQGLITGKSGGRLDPGGTASRAEVSAILMRYVQSAQPNAFFGDSPAACRGEFLTWEDVQAIDLAFLPSGSIL